MSSCRASTWSTSSTSQLILAGHGRPVREARALAEANRRAVHERIERVRRALAAGPRTPSTSCPTILDHELPAPLMIGWGLSEVLCYLRHLELLGEVTAGSRTPTPSAGRSPA